MSEVTRGESPRQAAELYLSQRLEWMADAVEAFGAERDADPITVFSAPTEVRAEAEDLEMPAEQEAKFREIAGKFGIGGEADIISSAEYQIIEGGKPWKIAAEAAITQNAQTLLFAGSPDRKIGEDEKEFMRANLSEDEKPADNEYDMARQVASLMPGFEPATAQTLPFGYDISCNHALVTVPTGQFIRIGQVDGKSVIMLRVDREDYLDENDQPKFRNRPAPTDLLRIVSTISGTTDPEASVAINSSNTYASRESDTVLAGLKSGRRFEVGMYGRQTLADVRDQEVAAPTELKQIPGELHSFYKKLLDLQAELLPNVH